jgi:hypothetical protein
VCPQRTGQDRHQRQRYPPRGDIGHQQQAADRFGREHRVGEHAGQADGFEIARGALEPVDEQFQHHAVRDEHDAEADAQQRRARFIPFADQCRHV